MEKAYGFIYKITNLITQKVYIGQTVQSVANRFTQHKSHAKRGHSHHKLARAIRKYGEENFIVETLETCLSEQELNERERYWIKHFNSIEEGYNINIGGQDYSCYYEIENAEEIIKYYQQCHNQVQTFQHFGITEYKFRQILSHYNIPTDYTNYGSNKIQIKIIELNLIFKSEVECAQYLIDNNYSSSKKLSCVKTNLARAITKNKKAYGLTFEKIDKGE